MTMYPGLLLLAPLMAHLDPEAVQPKPAYLAGWYNVLPAFPNYDGPRFDAPSIQRVKGSENTYSQKLHFKGTTALRRSFSITFARDVEFPKRYSSEAMQALSDPPMSMRIDDRLVWVWPDQRKIVVLVDRDKAVILENNLPPTRMPLVDCARKLDYKRIGEMLAKPPRTVFILSIGTFRALRKGDPLHVVSDWCGPSDKVTLLNTDNGQKRTLRYELRDGSTLFVTGITSIDLIEHEKDGKIEQLTK